MKTYYLLLAFGIVSLIFGYSHLADYYRYASNPYFMTGKTTDYQEGMLGAFSGVLISIISGILIERERKKI